MFTFDFIKYVQKMGQGFDVPEQVIYEFIENSHAVLYGIRDNKEIRIVVYTSYYVEVFE